MKKYFLLLILFFVFSAQQNVGAQSSIRNNSSTSPTPTPQAPNVYNIQTDPNQSNNLPTDVTQLQGSNPELILPQPPAPPGTAYCSSVTTTTTANTSCLNCLAGGNMYYPAPGGIGPECGPISTLCTDAYSSIDDQATCNDKYTQCTADGGSPDRCACKAIGGISLNTNVPFVGNCISLRASSSSNTTQVTPTTAFPRLLAGLTRIVMTVILIFCFMAIIVGGVLISMGGASEEQAKKGKDLIRHVVMALALLGASGVILRVINPSFFG